MAAEQTDIWEKVLFLFLGWLLGTLSPIITDTIRRQRKRANTRKPLFAELSELRYRLAIVVFRCESRVGRVDRIFLQWLKQILDTYGGPMAAEGINKHVDLLLAASDSDFELWCKAEQRDPEKGMSLKRYPVPFLKAHLNDVESLPDIVQPLLLEIHTQLEILDAELQTSRYYFELTFNPSITGPQRDRVEGNLLAAYQNYSNVARVIVDRINELERVWQSRGRSLIWHRLWKPKVST